MRLIFALGALLICGCSGSMTDGRGRLVDRIDQIPVIHHSGVITFPEHQILERGQQIEVGGCCILGELRMEVSWQSFRDRDDEIHVSGHVHDMATGEFLPGTYVFVGRIVEQKRDDRHEVQVRDLTRTDERGYFELTVMRERNLRLYVAMVGMMTAEYDISRLVK